CPRRERHPGVARWRNGATTCVRRESPARRFPMKPPLFLLGFALALPALAQSGDRLEGWSHGEANIYTHERGGPVLVGRVAADGTLAFDWPSAPSTEQTLGQTFVSCREDGQPMAEPASAE